MVHAVVVMLVKTFYVYTINLLSLLREVLKYLKRKQLPQDTGPSCGR